MHSTTNRNDSTSYSSDDERWAAVLERDSRAEGAFYYGVTSTGIFCRPTCPSRRPTRDRVAFFPASEDALRAGYRPCKRCRPDAESRDVEFVRQVVDAIDGWDDGQPTLANLSAIVGMSPAHLQRKFKQATGVSPAEYVRQRRIQRFRTGLKEGNDVTTSMYDAGFESSASLYESAEREMGMTPGEYRAGGKDASLRFVIGDTPLGRLLMAYSDRGIASIQIGNDDDELVQSLRDEFPSATIAEESGTHPWFQVILNYLGGKIPHPDLPVDVQGTAFQRRVWQAIRVVPPGETRSYREIAVEIDSPNAVRAVANACANNRIALVIPCHRIVRSDGKSGGYRWGEERKTALLALENSES
ncbi:MAG: bifunctional DNA-binding transcriptional regulator/O6-methylguanine-DNA methyltransferase Ada [Thermomicrobiales bacterium]